MKASDHFVTLAQEFWTQIKFCLPVVFCPVSEVRMWESRCFKESASDNVLVASDGAGGSRETTKICQTGRIWSGHFLYANSQ